MQKLISAGGSLESLDGVLLTHAHLDHTADLAALLFACKAADIQRERPLTLVHSPAMSRYIEGLNTTYGHWVEPGCGVERRELAPNQAMRIGEMQIRAFPVDHHETSVGYHLTADDDTVVVIPGDTGPCASLTERARRADVLIIECAATDEQRLAGHMRPSDVIELVREADPGFVVVTHQYPAAHRAGVVAQIDRMVDVGVVGARDGYALEIEDPAAEMRRWDTGQRLPAVTGEQSDVDIMREAVARLDPGRVSKQKYDTGQMAAVSLRQGADRAELGRTWTAGELASFTLSRHQRKLLKKLSDQARTNEINLRGSSAQEAARRLAAVVKTWHQRGAPAGRVVTGKGKHSEGAPVVKVAVANWLDGPGRVWVAEWIPEVAADGEFGSVVVQLRR